MPAALTAANLDSVGWTVPCGEVIVVDTDGREVPPGATGEIWIRCAMVVGGYWNNPAATAQNFPDGFGPSGDICPVDEPRFVRVFDRVRERITRRGYKNF